MVLFIRSIYYCSYNSSSGEKGPKGLKKGPKGLKKGPNMK